MYCAESLAMRTQHNNKWRRLRRRRITIIPIRTKTLATWGSIFMHNTDEFCRNTTIHGLKYINSRKLRLSDRVFFGLALLAVLSFAAFLILEAFEKWDTTPVIVGIDPEPTYITNEPFPAVTICNLNQALATKAAQFTSTTLNQKENQSQNNSALDQSMLEFLCHRNGNLTQHVNATVSWNRLQEFISNISQPCSAMIVGCRFGGIDLNCSHSFNPIVTDEGLCCVFNMLHPHFMFKQAVHRKLPYKNWMENYEAIDWYSEKGFPSPRPKQSYPRAAQGTGESLGLSLILDGQVDEYYCSSSKSMGFKISLHSPNEAPNAHETGVLLALGQETKLRIEPTKLVTELGLRDVDHKYRRCLFHGESKLQYFTHYTQRNCEMECVERLLRTHCGCVSLQMPQLHGNDTVCSMHKSPCVESIRLHTDAAVESCLDSCLPSCFDLTFNVYAFSAQITTPASIEDARFSFPLTQRFSGTYLKHSMAIVHMYYKEHTFRAIKQTEFIGITDFLSSVGGLMGLFLGFSFMSIAECVYFAIIRPCRTHAQLRRHRQFSTLELARAPTAKQQHQQPATIIPNVMWLEHELGHKKLQRLTKISPTTGQLY